jgi:hypothetical protein
MLFRPTETRARQQTRMSAAAYSTVVDVPQAESAEPTPTVNWPQRPDRSVLSESIPLFFISRDSDGFWIACEADHRVGGIFLSQRSALRFAQHCSEPTRCATMILEEPHNLAIENRGNRFVAQLRRAKRLATRLASKLAALFGTTIANARALGARWSRAYIEERILRAALEVEFYRRRYKPSNKNDDDLPVVG